MTQLGELQGRPVVIGAGLAGLMTALRLAEHEPVVVLTSQPLGEGAASGWAQGGVAAAVGADDSAALHADDTLGAGDSLCDPDAVQRITGAGADTIARLIALGARFDTTPDGALKLGLEAAHSRRRIVHANGDSTGREILRAMVQAAQACEDIAILEGVDARRLLLDANGAVAGVLAAGPDGSALTLRTARVVIATGGLGGLYAHTTNPRTALGQGLAMAARAGAELADMEFVQFHPTALDVGLDPMPLVSEAVRGEGAILIDDAGERFMASYARAELEPRDVVSRAVWAQLMQGRRVFLDARDAIGARFVAAFPQITAACRAAGVDPVSQPIPIRPAAHYHMGGIAVDSRGRTSVAGLWACGEVSSTGLHGANRLASNSLLEAAACGAEVALDVAAADRAGRRPEPQALPAAPSAGLVRAAVEQHAGVLRDRSGLEAAIQALAPLAAGAGPACDPALVGLFIAHGALARRESRGGHSRTDYPTPASHAVRTLLSLSDVLDKTAIAAAA
jgi:L-aspartate oxidase